MPTTPSRARRKLRDGKAVVERVHPFTIRLTYQVENPQVQEVSVGIDDGAKTAGIAVVQHNRDEDRVVFKAEIKLRNDVKKELSHRRMRRRARRSRLRNRQPRKRRKDKPGWIPPSVRVRKDNILRVVRDLVGLVPVNHVVYEEGQFDVRALWDEDMKDYQRGPNTGFENRRMAVLARDKYTCQYCGVNCIEAGIEAEVDHVIPRSRGGTWAWENLVCACKPCNQSKGNRAAAEFGYPEVRGRAFTYPTWLQQGKTYVKQELAKIAFIEVRYGWETSEQRKQLGLDKSHVGDAMSLAIQSSHFVDETKPYQIIVRRRRQEMHSRKHEQFAGFRHWDIVRYRRRGGGSFLGTVRSFVPSRKTVKCRLPFNDNYPVSVGRLQLVERPGTMVYLPQVWKGDSSSTGR